MKRRTMFAVVALCLASAAQAQARAEHVTLQTQVPLAGAHARVPCTGDRITFTQGYLHDLVGVTMNGGHFTGRVHDQLHSLKGTDTSGRSYEGVGITEYQFGGRSLKNGPFHETFVHEFGLVGKAGAPSYNTHETEHFTLAASGRVSVEFERIRITCG